MKATVKTVICIVLTFVLCSFALCACNEDNVENVIENKYDATLIDNADLFMREDFLNENRVSGAYYYTRYFDEETNTWKEKHVFEDDEPATREFVITNEEEYLHVFEDTTSIAVNFETQMLIVHMFVKYNLRPLKLTGINVENNALLVTFMPHRGSDEPDSCIPRQACIAVVMDKHDITTASFGYGR